MLLTNTKLIFEGRKEKILEDVHNINLAMSNLIGCVNELEQENMMLQRINRNLRADLRGSRNKHTHNNRWPQQLKKEVIQLRDIDKKSFSEITKLLNLNNRECRNLYHTAVYNKVTLKKKTT